MEQSFQGLDVLLRMWPSPDATFCHIYTSLLDIHILLVVCQSVLPRFLFVSLL